MNKIIKFITVFLTIASTIHSTLAQEDQSKKKGKLEIGYGLNILGPVQQMANLMVEYDFDGTTPNFFGGTIKHPHYIKVGSTVHISYHHYIGFRSQLGILLNSSRLNEVLGYSSIGGFLFVKFSSVSIVPLYSFELNKYLEFEVGPTLMINSGKKTSGGQDKDKYTKLSTGLLAGLNLKIWNGQVTFGKIGIYYMLATRNKMGPYNAMNSITVPESKISFSYLNMFFDIGLKL